MSLQHSFTFQEANLKYTSYSNYSLKSFKILIDQYQKKEREQIIFKHQSRQERKRLIQQRLMKMKIFNKTDKQQFKSVQNNIKKKSQCQISLKIQMCKMVDSNTTFLKHKPNESDMNFPYFKHDKTNFKKRQPSINKWKIIMNQQQKNMNATYTTTRSSSPLSNKKKQQQIKNILLNGHGLEIKRKNVVIRKKKQINLHKYSYLKKKYIAVNIQNQNNCINNIKESFN